jgi:hypothetical protein
MTKISRGQRAHLLRVAHVNADGQAAVAALRSGKMRFDLCDLSPTARDVYGLAMSEAHREVSMLILGEVSP